MRWLGSGERCNRQIASVRTPIRFRFQNAPVNLPPETADLTGRGRSGILSFRTRPTTSFEPPNDGTGETVPMTVRLGYGRQVFQDHVGPSFQELGTLNLLEAQDWTFPVPIAYGPGRLKEAPARSNRATSSRLR